MAKINIEDLGKATYVDNGATVQPKVGNVVQAPDVPKGTPKDIKKIFDANAENIKNFINKILIPALNGIEKDVDNDYDSESDHPQSGKAVAEAIANLVDSAPETLDTLGKLANALSKNKDVVDDLIELSTAIELSLENKLSSEVYYEGKEEAEEKLETVKKSIPTALSQLINDINAVTDKKYVHTDNNFTDELFNKLNNKVVVNIGYISDLSVLDNYTRSGVYTYTLLSSTESDDGAMISTDDVEIIVVKSKCTTTMNSDPGYVVGETMTVEGQQIRISTDSIFTREWFENELGIKTFSPWKRKTKNISKWEPNTIYHENEFTFAARTLNEYGGIVELVTLVCMKDHTSDDLAEVFDGTNWEEFWSEVEVSMGFALKDGFGNLIHETYALKSEVVEETAKKLDREWKLLGEDEITQADIESAKAKREPGVSFFGISCGDLSALTEIKAHIVMPKDETLNSASSSWKMGLSDSIYVLDANGDIVYEKDENGSLILDEQGNPIPKMNFPNESNGYLLGPFAYPEFNLQYDLDNRYVLTSTFIDGYHVCTEIVKDNYGGYKAYMGGGIASMNYAHPSYHPTKLEGKTVYWFLSNNGAFLFPIGSKIKIYGR